MGSLLERTFHLSARGTTVRREVLAGATTFVTMAYTLFVNPQIPSAVADRTGHVPPQPALLTSSALVAAMTRDGRARGSVGVRPGRARPRPKRVFPAGVLRTR